jgi:hypothetical protein
MTTPKKPTTDPDLVDQAIGYTLVGSVPTGSPALPFRPGAERAQPPSPWSAGEIPQPIRATWTHSPEPVPVVLQVPVAAPEPPREAPARQELVELLWVDASATAEARKRFRHILEDIEPDSGAEASSPDDDVHEILCRAEPAEAADKLLAAAVAERAGRFTPPLAVFRGKLELELDAAEVLRATHATLAVLPTVSKPQNDALDSVGRSLASPIVLELEGHAEGMLAHLADVWAAAGRVQAYTHSRTAAERRAVQKRCFRKVDVHAGPHLVSRLVRDDHATIVHVPEPAAIMLPPALSFDAVVLAHVHPPQHPEERAAVLRARAIARVHPR